MAKINKTCYESYKLAGLTILLTTVPLASIADLNVMGTFTVYRPSGDGPVTEMILNSNV